MTTRLRRTAPALALTGSLLLAGGAAAGQAAAAPVAAPVAAKAFDLGTVSGTYTLKAPAATPAGSWVLFALTGPKMWWNVDVSAPYQAVIDTTKLVDGTYQVWIGAMSSGSAPTWKQASLTIKNAKAGTPTPTPTKSPTTGTPAGTETAEVVRLTNIERAKAGCKPLTVDATVTKVAQAHSDDMAKNSYMSHTNKQGQQPWDRLAAAGYKYGAVAENIAAGQRTPQAVMTSWMNSAGHKQNILRCNLTVIGVGKATGGSYGVYWTQLFASAR